jgi:hypothetical protein
MSTTVNPAHTSVPATSRTTSNHPHPDSAFTNGHHHHHHHDAGVSHQLGSAAAAKKGKQKKVPDNSEASKLIAAKISQLELDAAGEKDQEAEIGQFDPILFYLCMENLQRGRGELKSGPQIYQMCVQSESCAVCCCLVRGCLPSLVARALLSPLHNQ